jgi:hypothetical protein
MENRFDFEKNSKMMLRTATEILDELNENGTRPTEIEIAALCNAAIEGEHVAAHLAAFEHALNRAGWAIVDMTTDDTDGTVFELVPPV